MWSVFFSIGLCALLRNTRKDDLPIDFAAANAPMLAPWPSVSLAAAPSSATASSPDPPRRVLPPVFPVANDDDCKVLEKSLVVDPKGRCEHIVMSANWDGCMCTIPQPGNINPMPENLFNPFAVEIPPDPNIPLAPQLAFVPPPSNPLAPFVPPMMAPECPYNKKCPTGDSTCVGFNSWGFSDVRMGTYSPASRHFNAIYCFYIMKPYDQFKTPKRILEYWKLQEEEKAKLEKNQTDVKIST